MKYKVIKACFEKDLEDKVTEAMEHGWTVSGSLVVVVFSDDSSTFFQPMIHA